MKFYSNNIFKLFLGLHILTGIAATMVIFLFGAISGLGCSLGCPPNYMQNVQQEVRLVFFAIILYLVISFCVLILQQYKNPRFGYFMIIILPLDIYLIYIALLPLTGLIFYSLTMAEGIFWFVLIGFFLLSALTPFYVLVKTVKHDLAKLKNK